MSGATPRRAAGAGRPGETLAGRLAAIPPVVRARALDVLALGLLLWFGALGFQTSFGAQPRFVVAVVGALVLGLAVAAAGARWRLGELWVVGLAVVGYLVAGPGLAAPAEAGAGVFPTLEAWRVLVFGVVQSWKDFLTVAPPVGVARGMLIVPFLCVYVGAIVAGTLAWRVRHPAWALLPVTAVLVAGAALGADTTALPVLRGVAVVLVAVAWLAWRLEAGRRNTAAAVAAPASATSSAVVSTPTPGLPGAVARSGRRRRLLGGAAVLTGAALLTALIAPVLAPAGERAVVRDALVPPLDLHQYPSPLMSFRQYVKDRKDDVLFTVQGLPKGERVRLAAMDAYNGIVYNVDDASSGAFAPVGDTGTLAGTGASGDGRHATVHFTIDDFASPWLPASGRIEGASFTGPRGTGIGDSLFYNADAETALTTSGVQKGDSYTLDVAYPESWSHDQLAPLGFADVALPDSSNVPEAVASRAGDLAGADAAAVDRVRNLEQGLAKYGYFSHGLEGQTRSLSGHGAARIEALLGAKTMVGDDEQYAVAMALMARNLGIPARVVMGFSPDWSAVKDPTAPLRITGDDVHAWVEVKFERAGWVPFNPTPEENKEPLPPPKQPLAKPKPQVLQPPPPPQEPAEVPPESDPDALNTDENKQATRQDWGPLLAIGLTVGIPLVVILTPLLVIAGLKSRRYRRRRRLGAPVQRISGGWSEVLSLAADLGTRVPSGATRREHAATVAGAFPYAAGGTTTLARRADAAVFGGAEPTEEQITHYWDSVDASLAGIRGSVSRGRRWRSRFSLRSLRADRAERRARRRAEKVGRRAEERRRRARDEGTRRGGTAVARGTVPVRPAAAPTPGATDTAANGSPARMSDDE
ncbi:transglutaminase domain-containing protein [Tersicoccus sp. MR15.9]|uniref:transglutaminase domain-containing protein n=1 Tax=Tersicoccus mangrovi TaxID=3121635 RepID=UPI002FE5570B